MTDCKLCAQSLSVIPPTPTGKKKPDPQSTRHLSKANVCCTSCGHLYHRQCLVKYLLGQYNNRGACPTCKTDISFRKIHPTYWGTNSFGNGSGIVQQNGSGDSTSKKASGDETDHECPICLDSMNEKPEIRNGEILPFTNAGKHLCNTYASANACCTACGHLFHKHCLVKYLLRTLPASAKKTSPVPPSECPSCSTQVNLQNVFPVYLTSSSNVPVLQPASATGTTVKRPLTDSDSDCPVLQKQIKSCNEVPSQCSGGASSAQSVVSIQAQQQERAMPTRLLNPQNQPVPPIRPPSVTLCGQPVCPSAPQQDRLRNPQNQPVPPMRPPFATLFGQPVCPSAPQQDRLRNPQNQPVPPMRPPFAALFGRPLFGQPVHLTFGQPMRATAQQQERLRNPSSVSTQLVTPPS